MAAALETGPEAGAGWGLTAAWTAAFDCAYGLDVGRGVAGMWVVGGER